MTRRFDAIVIGTGQAGPSLAARLSAAGRSVAVVERHLVGGTCVNTGCRPTKTLIASAYAAHVARRGADFGVITGGICVDMERVRARVRNVVEDARASNEAWLRGLSGCELIFGQAAFVGPKTVSVSGELLRAEHIFVNVGTRASVPDLPGVGDVPLLTSGSLMELGSLPRHLVVVGGSYVGLELGQACARLGARVTIVERGPRLVDREDEDVSECLRQMLEAEGIAVRTDSPCSRFEPDPQGVRVHLDCGPGGGDLVASHVLLAVGRVPNTGDLGLAEAGIAVDHRGYVIVDDRLETNVAGVWALGDCNGRGAFTHTSYNDFEIVAENLLDGADRRVTDRIPCYALYTDPPLGRVGLSAGQARAAGRHVKVGRRPMSRVARAVEKDEQTGFMEIVVDAETDRILGGTILGTGGDEAVHSILDMMANGATASRLRCTMHIHPTVSELIPTIAGEVAKYRWEGPLAPTSTSIASASVADDATEAAS